MLFNQVKKFAPFLPFIVFIDFLAAGDDSVAFEYSRYDRNAYDGTQDPSLDPFRFKHLRKLLKSNYKNRHIHANDDPNECSIYLAESSIPNSGLGLYTTTPFKKEDQIGHPDLGIIVQDPLFHYHFKSGAVDLLSQYVWAASSLTFGEHEVGHGEAACPGLGMLANCHYGLINFHHRDIWKNQFWMDGTDTLAVEGSTHSTLQDVGRGGSTWHGNTKFEATREIVAGEELFLSYGPQWYEHGARDFGGVIPSADHYTEADAGLRQFVGRLLRDGRRWEDQISHWKKSYEVLLNRASSRDDRLRATLPDNVEDIPEAIRLGTARFSAKDSIRSIEWIRENGVCVDKIVGGTSTIPQAGRGAFASRFIEAAEVISTTPVVTMDLDQLGLLKKGKTGFRSVGYQLLLNYCYGHKNSSLLFFPASPTVNIINHGGAEDVNAKIRWSNHSHHHSDWLNLSLEELRSRKKTGLMFDIIATKDIQRGEEVLLSYGSDWVKSWDGHIESWGASSNFTEMKGVPTTVDLNHHGLRDEMLKTVVEQETDPYPNHIMMRCAFSLPTDWVGGIAKDFSVNDYHYWPCDIVERDYADTADGYLFKAKVEHMARDTDGVTHYSVKYDSRQAPVRFVAKPYSRDQYRKGSFRHFIGLGDELMPRHWMDLPNVNLQQ